MTATSVDDYDFEPDHLYADGDRIVYRGQGGVVDFYDPDRDRYELTMDDHSMIRVDRRELDASNDR